MNPKWKKPRKPRRKRRAPKANPARGGVNSLALKPYNYVFTLKSQIFRDNITGALFGIPPSGGQFPVTNGGVNILASTNGFANYNDILVGTSFRLNDLGAVGSFTSMYDAYCIKKVTCEIEFLSNVAVVNGVGLMPTLYHYWDQDDGTPPTTTGAVVAKQGVIRRQFGNKMKTSLKISGSPKPLTDTSNLPSLINVKKQQWIDCLDASVEHVGLKMLFQDVYIPPAGIVNTAFRLNWKYHVAFRGPVITT